jgi:hypothetical protein
MTDLQVSRAAGSRSSVGASGNLRDVRRRYVVDHSMRRWIGVTAAAAAIAGATPALGFAQTPKVAVTAPPSAPPPAPRWLDVQTAALDARYRFVRSSGGVTTSNHLQYRNTLKLGVRLDRAGRYSVQALAGTGTSFTGSWENSGLGSGDADWNPRVRHFYVAGKPARGVELQVGGLGMARTESTEITGFDNDGYMVGERVSVKRPKDLYLDEVTLTVGYLGDLGTPNVFTRLDSLDDHNFTQLVVARKLGARVVASADWVRIAGIQTWREAAHVAVREAKVFDAVRLELYQRVDGVEGHGFAAGFEKALPGKVGLTLGWADIDPANPTVSGDRYGRGQRLFVDARMPLPADLSVNVFCTRAVDSGFAVPTRTRFDLVVSYNVLKAFQRAARSRRDSPAAPPAGHPLKIGATL